MGRKNSQLQKKTDQNKCNCIIVLYSSPWLTCRNSVIGWLYSYGGVLNLMLPQYIAALLPNFTTVWRQWVLRGSRTRYPLASHSKNAIVIFFNFVSAHSHEAGFRFCGVKWINQSSHILYVTWRSWQVSSIFFKRWQRERLFKLGESNTVCLYNPHNNIQFLSKNVSCIFSKQALPVSLIADSLSGWYRFFAFEPVWCKCRYCFGFPQTGFAWCLYYSQFI